MPLIHRLALASAALSSLLASSACTDDLAPAGTPRMIVPASLDLGAGDCGATATATFDVGNDGDDDLAFELASLDAGVTVVPASGTVAPGARVRVTVTAAVPATFAAGTALTATLRARGSDGVEARIPVAFATRGAQIVIDPPIIGLGEQPVGVRATRPFNVRNLGNASASVRITGAGDELAVGFDGGELWPGGARAGEVSYLPRSIGADSAVAGVEITGAVCGGRPPALQLSGQGVPGEGILVQGGPIDFGTVTCNRDDAERTITLVNPTDLAGSFTARMWDTDFDDLNFAVSPAQGTIPARGSVTVTVRRLDTDGIAMPRQLASTLRVITSLGADAIHDVPVREVVRTAQLVVDGDTDFGWVPGHSNVALAMTITNRGTAPARVVVSADAPMQPEVSGWLAPGESTVGWVRYAPTSPTFDGALKVTSPDACQFPIVRRYSAGHGGFAIMQPLSITTTPAWPVTSASLRVSNPGDRAVEIACRPVGPNPLALVLATSTITVPARSAGAFALTMAAGDGSLGTVSSALSCIAAEGVGPELVAHEVTVSRTVIDGDAPLPR